MIASTKQGFTFKTSFKVSGDVYLLEVSSFEDTLKHQVVRIWDGDEGVCISREEMLNGLINANISGLGYLEGYNDDQLKDFVSTWIADVQWALRVSLFEVEGCEVNTDCVNDVDPNLFLSRYKDHIVRLLRLFFEV